ncbi:helix-turn-helix domain-containing protein [Clostridium thailandense]|uniref:helix-turn-helix domain-containing protein n=1 Tax=Clostridium thailandense TaxID=2794346 RepID=UPI00398907B8
MTNIQKEKIQKLRQEGQSYSKIASALNISENTIKSYCRRNNLGATESTKTKTEKEIYSSCKHCGKPLTYGTKGQPKKFCSEECRRLWWKANDSKLDKKAYYHLSCAECGKEFESYGNKNRKFCSHACYINRRFKKESV